MQLKVWPEGEDVVYGGAYVRRGHVARTTNPDGNATCPLDRVQRQLNSPQFSRHLPGSENSDVHILPVTGYPLIT